MTDAEAIALYGGTYTVSDPEELFFEIGGIITDALTGISYAVSKNGGVKVALGVPLCVACDEMVQLCECHSLAPVVRLSATRIAA